MKQHADVPPIFPPLFATRAGRKEVKRAQKILQRGTPQRGIDSARQLTRRNFVELLSYGTVGASLATLLGYAALTRNNDIGKLTPERRTERFLEIGHRLQQQGYGQVEWRHPTGGPRDPMFVRSFMHENPDGTLSRKNHVPILVQEFRSAIFAYEQGLRHFAVEGLRSDARIPPIAFLMERSWSSENVEGIPIYPETLHEIPEQVKKDALAKHPDMRLASQADCQAVFSMEKNMVNVFQVQAREHVGTRFGNILAASLPEDARVMGLEDPAFTSEFETFYAEHVQRSKSREKITAAISKAISKKEHRMDMGVHFDENGQIVAVEIAGEIFPIDELMREMRDIRDSVSHRGPTEPFHRRREKYIAESLDAHMAFFGTDHLYNFRKMQTPPRSVGIVWPTMPYFDEKKEKGWGMFAEIFLTAIEEARKHGVTK